MSGISDFFATYASHWADWWPQLVPAIWVTIRLTLACFALAVVLGVVAALGKLSHNRPLRWLANTYVELARGMPAVAILFLLYFGLVGFDIVLDGFTAGVVGLGLSGGGYFAEVFRTGILAVPAGQKEAAAAVGMTPFQSFRFIVLPQAMRVVLPPTMNLFTSLLKDTSLCSLITVPELMLRSKDLAMMSFLPMHTFTLAAVVYFALAWPVSLAARRVERRMSRGLRAG